ALRAWKSTWWRPAQCVREGDFRMVADGNRDAAEWFSTDGIPAFRQYEHGWYQRSKPDTGSSNPEFATDDRPVVRYPSLCRSYPIRPGKRRKKLHGRAGLPQF